jgi:hypothetical protein
MKINFPGGDVKLKLTNNKFQLIFYLILFVLLILPSLSTGSEIIGPETKIVNNEIHVSTGLILDKQQIQDLENGITKEITFYIDLFRTWKMWPDEFILGKIIVKTLSADPVKKEYVATSLDGTIMIEKRFSDLDSLLKWSLNVNDLQLTNIKELVPDEYFVKITVKSRLRKLPPVIRYLFLFVPEMEFKKTKDSPKFQVGQNK